MNTQRLRRTVLSIVMALCMAFVLSRPQALAASGDGSLFGHIAVKDKSSLEGLQVTVQNPETGFTRTVKPDAEGNYRFPYLPVGRYVLRASQGEATVGELADVTVALGTATTANIDLGATATLETVEIVGSRIQNQVDVSSTESATNITRDELLRLPVQRDAVSVALLAPGLVKGDAALGSEGISFGGSSVAENSIYVNGLNVTDFYNRVGSSTVPYAFYKEFQVKTGGYSVEFGRTTGGVINAVTRSGTNQFEFGTEATWEPSFLQTAGSDHPGIVSRFDEYDRTNVDVYAGGPIIKDKLFFFALYEFRDYEKKNTSDSADTWFDGKSDDGFWGGKIDWQINDRNLLELLAFSDKSELTTNSFDFDLASGSSVGPFVDRQFRDDGGRNWAATYTTYLTQSLSAKAMYGKNEREFSVLALNDIDCNRVRDRRDDDVPDLGCSFSTNVSARTDDREAARLDFEWQLADHQLRFGMDREVNTSNHKQHYPGPGQLLYEINPTEPGTQLENDGIVPAGVFAYVRTRRNEVDGEFESLNSAFYLEDNWSVTPRIVLNAGVRLEGFDNKNSDGDSYIKIDDMVAPRFGFSWDVRGDSRSKVFGNVGRYFLPVANVINIKQAGGFLDERTYYVFDGLDDFEYNGQTYQRPRLGAQIGAVDNSQGDGTVGDLRGEVDADMDPVYQDEFILGFQSMISDQWSWGVRGIYRLLHNAIDDMEITSNGILCGGEPTGVGFVMGNPGKPLTVFTDTNCDGENDAFVTIDTAHAGWALLDDAGNFVGERGYPDPRRDYKALEFVMDRSWDNRWEFNGTYTLSFSKGNAEGPVNSDTNFADAGRTENFDNPFVNLGGYGPLANDRRHQFKLRGSFGLNGAWQFGSTLNIQSGRPINAFGLGNPIDSTSFQSFYVCVANCTAPPSQRQFELHKRGSAGRTPWTFDVGASVTYNHSFQIADLQAKLAVYNLFNQERVLDVDEYAETDIGVPNDTYRFGQGFQSPRFALLTVNVKF